MTIRDGAPEPAYENELKREVLKSRTPDPAYETKFDLKQLKGGIRGRIVRSQRFYGILRRLRPVLTLRGNTFVTRFDDVQEVLTRDEVFHVPFGPKMEKLASGTNFILGMPWGDAYQRQRDIIRGVFQLSDIHAVIRPFSKLESERMVAESDGQMDAIRDLVTLVPTMICERYYGIPIADKQAFADWTFAMSNWLFADAGDDAKNRGLALAGAELVRRTIDDAIATCKASRQNDTVVGRLVQAQQKSNGEPSDDEIRTIIIGMTVGFVPTNTLAAGHALDVLLSRPEAMKLTHAAASNDDDDMFRRCVLEAMRLQPPLPLQFRLATKRYCLKSGAVIKQGAVVLASTQSAMMDGRRIHNARQFVPGRPSSQYMLFGHGLHWCIGAAIAEAQITQTLKALLRRPNLQRVGELERIGPFPRKLLVSFGQGP